MTSARGSALRSARYLVGALGMTIVLLVAVAFPVGFGLHHYDDHTSELDFKAKLNADRLAKFIYSYSDSICGGISRSVSPG